MHKHSFTIDQVSLSADGRTALTASGDGTARIWNLETAAHVRKLGGFFGGTHGDAVTAAALSPDGAFALTGSLGKEIKFWDVDANRLIHTFSGSDDWSVHVWDM